MTSPSSAADWVDWVAATRTRNFALEDPFMDWINEHGKAKGYVPDTDLPGYDPRTDFTRFIMRKGREFETAVLSHICNLADVETIAKSPSQIRTLVAAEATFEAMERSVPVIAQAVLREPESRTYGAVDFLIRSDELSRLFPGTIEDSEAELGATDLPGPWHYRAVDVKYTTLNLNAAGQLGDSGSAWAYKMQTFIYNRALGRLQGFTPEESYVLGRGWKKGQERGTSFMEKLGAVPNDYVSRTKGPLVSSVEAACEWVRRVRTEGSAWEVLPEPSVQELRPNMGSTSDHPWHHAKQDIGHQLEDLTLLWQVGAAKRNQANANGITRWTQDSYGPGDVGVTGEKRAPVLQAILDANRGTDGPVVSPARISASEDQWRSVPELEFYVDFEWVSDLEDDFTLVPERGGQPMIFMVGCGHVENGEWQWTPFVADQLDDREEGRILDRWIQHMAEVKGRLDPEGPEPLVFHWSPAEQSSFDTAFNSARARHPDKSWPSQRWFDVLAEVVRAQPVTVRGALGFGLKQIGSAMHAAGLTSTDWKASSVDGLGAMVGAWWCDRQAAKQDVAMLELPLMQEIRDYNEIDCKVIWEIVSYLRANR